MYVTVRGKRRRLDYVRMVKDDGRCEPNGDMQVRSSLKGKARLEAEVHELMHACHWDLAEEAIDETAQTLTEALWKIGYRMP